MSDAIVVALIAAASSVIGPVVLYLVTTRRHRETKELLAENTGKTGEVLHQVKNDHTTNLREELDARFGGLHDKLERVEAAQGYLGGTVGHLIRDVKDSLRHQREHETAAGLALEQLQRRDDELAAELRRLSDPPPG